MYRSLPDTVIYSMIKEYLKDLIIGKENCSEEEILTKAVIAEHAITDWLTLPSSC